MQIKQNAQSGFTLIELVMVIVILGILAATALPKFVDLKGDAELAALNGVVGAVNAAGAVNYAAYQVSATKGTAITTGGATATILNSIMAGGTPADFTFTAAIPTCSGPGASVDIIVTATKHVTNKTATAKLICTA